MSEGDGASKGKFNAPLTGWKRSRQGYRMNAQQQMDKLQGLLKADPPDEAAVALACDKLSTYQVKLNALNEQVLGALADDSEVATHVDKSMEMDEALTEHILLGRSLLQRRKEHRQSAAAATPTPAQPAPVHPKVTKLPVLQIEPFDGDTLQWQSFWDSFQSSIDCRTDLSDVEKLKYLRSYLKGEPFNLADGYRVVDANYQAVVDTLRDWYDNRQAVIFAHLKAMFGIKPASGDVHQMQQVFYDCERHIRSLVALGLSEDTFSLVFVPIMLSKVPKFMRVQMYLKNGSQDWTLANLRTYLKEQIQARQWGERSLDDNGEGQQGFRRKGLRQGGKGANVGGLLATGKKVNPPRKPLVQAKPTKACVYCGANDHFYEDCSVYSTVDSRKARIVGKCEVCLQQQHPGSRCSGPKRVCFHCKQVATHHRSLCPTKYAGNKTVDTRKNEHLSVDAPPFKPVGSLISAGGLKKPTIRRGETVMQTAVTTITGPKGSRQVRIVMDSASSRSFCRLAVLKDIGAHELDKETLSLGGIESDVPRYREYGCYSVTIALQDGGSMDILVTALKSISCPVDQVAVDLSQFPIPPNIQLADPAIKSSEQLVLDVNIGLDYYYRIVRIGAGIQLSDGFVLLETKLGYIAGGSLEHESASKSEHVLLAITEQPNSLDDAVERLWRIDDVGLKDQKQLPDDAIAEQKFESTIQFNVDEGRYEVKWPMKDEVPDLPLNYPLALGRLSSLIRRLEPELKIKYNETIQDQICRMIIEVAPTVPDGDLVHYLPHHCVLKPDKATTKIRIVHDASSKVRRDSKSLNDCLYRGPVQLADLCGLLVRFRLKSIAISCDLEKAFLMVGLQKQDRDVTRFLWLKDVNAGATKDNLIEYRFRRVPFGTKASSYMLSGTIKHHLERLNTDISRLILSNSYVDNVIVGVDTVEDAKNFYAQAKDAFASAGMNLREFASNEVNFIDSLPKPDIAGGDELSVLGLKWNVTKDVISCSTGKVTQHCTTKRHMLQMVAKVFDPCGFMAPVLIKGKAMIQRLWKKQLTWDEDVPEDVQRDWNCFEADLSGIHEITIDRWIGTVGRNFTLHGFCDASALAYAVVFYLASDNGSCLCFAKARVSPLKGQTLTIPRLELTAVVTGVKLAKYLHGELHGMSCPIVIWTDSLCTLHWITRGAQKPLFVKNRVAQIRETVTELSIDLRYVPTKENPADLPTRGMTAKKLRDCALWWHGPNWLSNKSSWPAIPTALEVTADVPDVSTSMVASVISAPPSDFVLDLARYSSFLRARRVLAWTIRFISSLKGKKPQSSTLSVDELRYAQSLLLRNAQQRILAAVKRNKDPIVRQLGLFIDDDGIVRCSGRLDSATLPYDARFPVFLPKGNKVTALVIHDLHEKLAHAGVQHMLASLRSQYWVAGGRNEIKRHIRDCRMCRRKKHGHYAQPRPPPLPDFRSSQQASFRHTGVDYLGPLLIRSKDNDRVKVWIAVFTCAVSRAIHLEVVPSLSASDFLLCLRRFFALRNLPRLIICDNATAFRAGKSAIDKVWRDAIKNATVQDCCASRGIAWKFVVEMGPWMGGFYERMVGLVKSALRCSIDNTVLNLPELQTLCYEIADILNSRPLTYAEDAVGDVPLTPNDLMSHTNDQLPANSNDDNAEWKDRLTTADKLSMEWRRLKNRLGCFWKKWHASYLVSLREKHWSPNNRGSSDIQPSIGDVVLIHDKLPRGQWRMGRIVQLLPSVDGRCRAAKVFTGGRTLTRPIKLLYPLEIGNDATAPNQSLATAPPPTPPQRPSRAAAKIAQQRISAAAELESEEDE